MNLTFWREAALGSFPLQPCTVPSDGAHADRQRLAALRSALRIAPLDTGGEGLG
jgi:hypothetical protein